MCKDCYLVEIEGFESQNQFQEFDLNLLKKIHNTKTMERMEDFSKLYKQLRIILSETYKCKVCSEVWHLSAPSGPWNGFFKKATN